MDVFTWLRRKPPGKPRSAAESPRFKELFKLPEPPPGFGWHRFDQARVAVLKPDSWHTHERSAKSLFTGCVSKENVKERGSFQTGLTVRLVCRVLDRFGLPPSEFAAGHCQRTAKNAANTIVNAEQGAQQHGLAEFIVRYRSAPATAEPIMVHHFSIAHDTSDELHIFKFESPERTWDESWAIGERILKHLVLGIALP